MASFTGHDPPRPEAPSSAPHISANVTGAAALFGAAASGAALALETAGGVRAEGEPVYPAQPWDGGLVPSFRNDYYYRIHLQPALFDLGNLLGPEQREFSVWNAWFTDKTCTSIDAVNGSEVDLTGPSAPFNLGPLQSADYVAGIGMNGQPNFETVFTFIFGPETPAVTFIGRRVVLFGYPPLKPFTEALEWLTDILAAHNGAEQRRALRYAPRQKFSAGFRVAGVQAVSRLAALAFGWHHRAWGLPLWAEASLHQTDILEGAESVAVATAGADYREGGLAVIWRSPEDYEVFEVLALSADYLETSRPLANAWTGRKFIMPVRLAYFEGHPEWDARRSGLAEMRVQFIISDNVHLAGYEAGQTYGGLPVLTRPNLLSGGREAASLVKEMKFLDSETGPFQADCFDLYQRRRVERRTALRSRAEAWDFRLLLHELAGRQGVVWIPTFRPDLVLLADVGADEVNLIVQETGAALHYGSDNPLRGHLAFIAPDGAIVCRAVTGITAGDPGQEIVTIDSGLPEAFGPGDYTISWLALSRLDADRVEIEWRDVGRAEVRTAWREVAA